MASINQGLNRCGIKNWLELPRRAANETHFILSDGDELVRLCAWAGKEGYYLCTLAANDERLLEDGVFKLYYVLSDPANQLVIVEHPLKSGALEFPSIRGSFHSAEWLEREARDLFGIIAADAQDAGGFVLHECFPPDLYPLRQNRSHQSLHERIRDWVASKRSIFESAALPHGVQNLIVGPIHAGVIQPGQFRFHVAGEVIEDLDIRLGYTHRGIEKLFATHYTVLTGHILAERVAGDASVAHALAFCQAVEGLTDETAPLPPAAACWRVLLLEMERLYNHIGDAAALVHDMAFDLVASELAVLREHAVSLNAELTGHRLLRGAVHPGGVAICHPEALPDMVTRLGAIVERFLTVVSRLVLANPACRARAETTGVLTTREAREMGATGLPARASGLWRQDFRLRHPQGVYVEPELGTELRALIEQTITEVELPPSRSDRSLPVAQGDLHGDVFARLLLRVAEVETSGQLIRRLAQELMRLGSEAPLTYRETMSQALRNAPNFEIGLGYVESWRGDVFYVLMKGPGNTIFRCQVRDPSLYNWPALRLAVIRKLRDRENDEAQKQPVRVWENILADFPLINKSFNLSYAGHDR